MIGRSLSRLIASTTRWLNAPLLVLTPTRIVGFSVSTVLTRSFDGSALCAYGFCVVNCDNTLIGLGKRCHEPPERGTELHRIEQSEQPVERVVAGRTVLQLEETAQQRLLRPGKNRHVHRALPATQNRAQGNRQQFVEVVQAGIPAPPVLQIRKARGKLIQFGIPLTWSQRQG